LAKGLAAIPGLAVDGVPQTNMVFVSLVDGVPADAEQVGERLSGLGVKVGDVAERRFRLVTHYWIDDAAVDRAVEAFAQVMQGLAVSPVR
jgi:threonine aldolase